MGFARKLSMWAASLFMTLALVLPSTTSAEAYEYVVYNDTLHVQGKVLPARQILIDEHGEITKIFSNTDQDVVPRVYLGTISRESARELTPEVLSIYKKLVPDGHGGVGVLYDRDIELQSRHEADKPFTFLNVPLLISRITVL